MKMAILVVLASFLHTSTHGPFTALAGNSFTYWIQPCTKPETRCEQADEQLVKWALQAWQNASAGLLSFSRADSPSEAQLRVYWVPAREGLYGETRGTLRQSGMGADVFIRPELEGLGPEIGAVGARDHLFRDTIVFLTALHELGHALGLPHTRAYNDIMYNFGWGGDITEYFARYRRKLSKRESIEAVSGLSSQDIQRLLFLYNGTRKSE